MSGLVDSVVGPLVLFLDKLACIVGWLHSPVFYGLLGIVAFPPSLSPGCFVAIPFCIPLFSLGTSKAC